MIECLGNREAAHFSDCVVPRSFSQLDRDVALAGYRARKEYRRIHSPSVQKGVPFRKRLSRNAEFVVGLDGVNDLL
jgi:hypothetical protein